MFQSYVAVSVFHVAFVFIWMLHMFYTYVASVCPKCFICFKCMLHLSVSCCKCKPPALVSMRAGRAKPQPPTRGGGAGRAVLLWKRRGRVIRAARAVDLKRAVRMQARKMELTRTVHESKRTERSSHGRPDVRALVNPFLKSLI
jgi:poly(3-hydroxybutyrate) depolymerase